MFHLLQGPLGDIVYQPLVIVDDEWLDNIEYLFPYFIAVLKFLWILLHELVILYR